MDRRLPIHPGYDWDDSDEDVHFEKIEKPQRAPLPVSSESRNARSAKETVGSRRAGGRFLKRLAAFIDAAARKSSTLLGIRLGGIDL